jgi:hypothetical protein
MEQAGEGLFKKEIGGRLRSGNQISSDWSRKSSLKETTYPYRLDVSALP